MVFYCFFYIFLVVRWKHFHSLLFMVSLSIILSYNIMYLPNPLPLYRTTGPRMESFNILQPPQLALLLLPHTPGPATKSLIFLLQKLFGPKIWIFSLALFTLLPAFLIPLFPFLLYIFSTNFIKIIWRKNDQIRIFRNFPRFFQISSNFAEFYQICLYLPQIFSNIFTNFLNIPRVFSIFLKFKMFWNLPILK